tara:strand:+ start:2671 stop:2871 length:201 start_codon:yes stop_codon:yes gene_type:complete
MLAVAFVKDQKIVGWFTPDQEANVDYKGSPTYFGPGYLNLFTSDLMRFAREQKLQIALKPKHHGKY